MNIRGYKGNMKLKLLNELIEEITVDAYGDDEQLWAFRQVIEDEAGLPAQGFVIGEPVLVVAVEYDGNERRGLTARCRREDGAEYEVALSEVVFPQDSAGGIYVAAYRKWLNLDPCPAGMQAPAQPKRRRQAKNAKIQEGQMDLRILAETPPWEWPKGVDKMLLAILADGRADADDRILAADLAGDFTVINDALVDALLTILQNKDESEDLRGTAATSLGPVLEYTDTDWFDGPEDDNPVSDATIDNIQDALRRLYLDAGVPESVRRRILEASVRSRRDWHQDAVRAAWSGKDEEWRLTAVFAMRWIGGFENQILEALKSDNPDIHYEAVCAAGYCELDAAWPHISKLIEEKKTDKELLLAAIEASVNIRPEEAGIILADMVDSDDEDIADAAYEAMAMIDGMSEDDFDDDEEDDDDDEDDNE